MTENGRVPSCPRIMESMIELTGLAKTSRVIVEGSEKIHIYLDLHRRGYARAVTTATCRIPCGKHDAALVAGHHSTQALEDMLVRIVHFLNAAAVLAVWVSSSGNGRSEKIR